MGDLTLSEEKIFQRAYGQARRDRRMVENIRGYRESQNLTQQQVADVMGAKLSQVVEFESGRWNYDQRFLREYSVAIGLEIHYTFKESEQ